MTEQFQNKPEGDRYWLHEQALKEIDKGISLETFRDGKIFLPV